MVFYLTTLEEQFDNLVEEGENITEKFKRENLLKGVIAEEYQKLIIKMRTHEEWCYETCVEKFRLLGGALERSLARGVPGRDRRMKSAKKEIPKMIAGVEVDDTGQASRRDFWVLSDAERGEFIRERHKLREKGFFNQKQGSNKDQQGARLSREDSATIVKELKSFLEKEVLEETGIATATVHQATSTTESAEEGEIEEETITKAKEKMTVNEIITTWAAHYLNAKV